MIYDLPARLHRSTSGLDIPRNDSDVTGRASEHMIEGPFGFQIPNAQYVAAPTVDFPDFVREYQKNLAKSNCLHFEEINAVLHMLAHTYKSNRHYTLVCAVTQQLDELDIVLLWGSHEAFIAVAEFEEWGIEFRQILWEWLDLFQQKDGVKLELKEEAA